MIEVDQAREQQRVFTSLHVLSFLFCAFLLQQSFAAARAKEVRRVLVLSEVGPYYPVEALHRVDRVNQIAVLLINKRKVQPVDAIPVDANG
jgi:hypothetical protein